VDAVFVTCQLLALLGLVYGFLVCAASYRASGGADPSYEPFSEYPLGTSNPKWFRPRDLPDVATSSIIQTKVVRVNIHKAAIASASEMP
jgi:hypothetical protein